ncbi:hypothetical protein [Pontibacter sp. G13]|uniref:hypothetical protein n=1 Tax=Pontibacter sp. G13 TaxID=3074898 RepID=UPI00288AFCB1|nr:hypothetical protein [Pontibacter sp. G13]WNJ16436.1 hypothetical protein RJD25_16345 [Pontibacter sp. G13]
MEQNELERGFFPQNPCSEVKAILKEAFFWETVNETSPFGSEYGADTLIGFVEWRAKNPQGKVLEFAFLEIESFGFEHTHLKVLDENKVRNLVSQYQLDPFAQDWIVIAAAFAQYVWEGNIDSALLSQAVISTRRQKTAFILEYWNPSVREERAEKLEVMLRSLEVIKRNSSNINLEEP